MNVARKNTGRKWRIVGCAWKAGKRIKQMTRTVVADNEAKIERAENRIRKVLVDHVTEKYKGQDLKNVKIEVESDID